MPGTHGSNADTRWVRGQMHAHTYASDGRGFLEQAVAAHRARGYQFLFVSDHNRFADQPDLWRTVADCEGPWPPQVSREMFANYLETCGAAWVRQRLRDHQTEVRLRTFAEVKQKMDVAGEFLLLPGVEITQAVNGRHVHLNYLNLPRLLPSLLGSALVQTTNTVQDVKSLIAVNAAEFRSMVKGASPPGLLMLNHPFWRYYDIQPQDVFDRPEIRFVEICSSADYPPAAGYEDYTLERFWDIANAFRLRKGLPPLFGVGADDAHYYDPGRIDGTGGVGGDWVMVRAATLSPAALTRALLEGNFYATCGVLLDCADFCRRQQTLRIKVKPEPGLRYRIDFVATSRNFDPEIESVAITSPDGKVRRHLPVCCESIGKTVAVVEGLEAVYRLMPDDLYVRARITADRPARSMKIFHPPFETAWTQPFYVL